MELDEALKLVGAYGKYQILLWLLVAVMDSWTASWHMLIMTFIGYEPPHHCKVLESVPLNVSLPFTNVNGEMSPAKCKMYTNFTTGNETETCVNGWRYDSSVMGSSIVTEWDLVCDYNYLAETTQSLYMVGLSVGGFTMGTLSDRFGRKKVMFVGFAGQAVFGVIVALSTNIYMFMVFRLIVGIFVVAGNFTAFVMACELFPTKQRSIFGSLHELQWIIGSCVLTLITYVLRYTGWRYIELAIALPSLLTFLFWRIVPESVPWLISKRRLSDAEKVLEKAAKFNGRQIPPRCLHAEKSVERKDEVDEIYTPLALFRTPQLRKFTLGGSLLWFANVVVYYGLYQNAPNLAGDLYLNFLLLSIVEIPALALAVYLLYRKGRRLPIAGLYLFCGVVCVVAPFVPEQTGSGVNLTWLTITLIMIGKFSISCAFTISIIYTVELFPTVVRSTGYSFTTIFGRLGGVLYPYILYLNKREELGSVSSSLPYLIFGGIATVTAAVVFFLPETSGRPLQTTIEEVEGESLFDKSNARKSAVSLTKTQSTEMTNDEGIGHI